MQLKKILAIFLAATLIFSATVVPAAAESVETLKVGVVAETTTPISSSPVIYNQGDEVSVKISVDQNTGISFLAFDLDFDENALELLGVESAGLFNDKGAVKTFTGFVRYFLNQTSVSVDTGLLYTAKFKVKEGFCGKIDFTATLQNNRPANCARVSDTAANTHVPFSADEWSATIHKIDPEFGITTAPTCLEKGFTRYGCESCQEAVIGNIVDALGHTEAEAVEENRVEATCTEDGNYDSVVYCSVCEAELSRENKILHKLGHDLTPHEAKAPTCTEIGWEAYETCSRCDYTTYKELEALGHTEAEAVEENRVEATCTEAGSYDSVVYCSVCNAELSREKMTIDALGHAAVSHEAKAPTCTEIGWEAYETCSRCDYTTYKELEALGHTEAAPVEEKRVEATCTEDGSFESVVYCSVCEAELSREVKTLHMLGHDTVKHEAKAPTCTEIGWEAYETCTRCDYTTYVELKELGHTEAAPVEEKRVEPTCTEAGSYESVVYCSVCNAELSREAKTIEALGHDTIAHEAKAPTCTEIGWEAYETCARCDYTTYKELAALGHKYGETTVFEPAYKVDGYSVHTCEVCGYEEKFDIVPALTYILGDIDGDEVITSDDAIALLYHILLPEKNPINQGGDLNGDGLLNSDDAVYLLYHIARPDAYPLSK